MARRGLLRTGDAEVATPNVLLVRVKDTQDIEWAEAFLSTKRSSKSILMRDVQEMGPSTPPPVSRPLSLASLEFPPEEDIGDVSFLADPHGAGKSRKEVVAFQNTVEFTRYPKRFVRQFISLREAAGYQRAVYAPLLATPANLPMLIYCGVDLVDGLRVHYDSRKGYFHTPDGRLPSEELEDWPCMCPACEQHNLLEHNLRALIVELRKSRTAISTGRLRELVEQRVSNDPWMTAVLRELDYRCYEWQEIHFPVVGPPLRAYSAESLFRPEVLRFRRRVLERYSKPPSAKVLLLLPCSARKPYSSSKSHRLIRSVIRAAGNPWAVHVVVVTSPLGIVPSELELFHPVRSYDIPVTGDWSKDEAAVLQEEIEGYLRANEYEATILHLGPEAKLVESILEDVVVTSRDDPRSTEALQALQVALEEATSDVATVPAWIRRQEDLQSMARFQFGPGAEALVDDCTIKGRYPNFRLFAGGQQVAALTGARGMFSLTLEGGGILADKNLYCVEIDDFFPEGNVFAVGVLEAHEEVRVGDDVVVCHENEVRAVGVARMNPVEMRYSNRGEAVRVRHRAKKATETSE